MILIRFSSILIDLVQKTLIELLIAKKVKILIIYSDLQDIFLEKKALVLLEIINWN